MWMAEYLRTTRYNDGTPIPLITSDTGWLMTTSTPACAWYEDSASVYGVLYNYFTVADTNSPMCAPLVGTFLQTQTGLSSLITWVDLLLLVPR